MIPVRIIVTRYLGPTTTRGSRVSASDPSGRHATLPWDYSLNTDENHDRAACALAESLGWDPPTMAGNLPGPDRVYVVTP